MPARTTLLAAALLMLALQSPWTDRVAAQATEKKKKSPINPALRPISDEPGLPRVLLIGDSISIGYTIPVRQMLDGKANVHRPTTNCGPTTRGLEQLDQWLGDKPWDVIHFNWGLHDLKYMGPNGENLTDPNDPASKPQVPLNEYEQNLRSLVERLKKTGAKLIWCSTTPVPEGSSGRVVGDAAKYNAVAAKVMAEQGVAINDLYVFAKPKLSDIQRPANVHFTVEGSRILAEEVSRRIQKSLDE